MGWIVGVDVGGTFTDFQAIDLVKGNSVLAKRPSTPHDLSEAIIKGIQDLEARHDVPLKEIVRLSHGTTVATNALIQRRGGRVCVITNNGFRDLLEIGRQTRPHMFDLQLESPAPLAERCDRHTVKGRILADGTELRPLDTDGLSEVIRQIKRSGVEACAVCLMFSFVNPSHEQEIARRLEQALPDLPISLSSEVQPEFREFERFTSTTINAYLRPVMQSYIARLDTDLRGIIPNAKISINQSNGGLMSLDTARSFPIRTALSGPAAGVVGAVDTARAAQCDNVITLDVGGTSADLALIRNGEAEVSYDREVADFPIRLPMVDVSTIGAGGGSIARFDAEGMLKVGPQSAGAVPGPACYNRGGVEPTVSDANLILGRLSPELINGEMTLRRDLAEQAMAPIAERLGVTLPQAANGILHILVANMVRAIRRISIERGHDPRGYTLMPFGGAGPMHARPVAIELGISKILVPAAPGILCAQGLLVSEAKETFVTTKRMRLDAHARAEVNLVATELLAKGQAWRKAEALPPEDCRYKLSLDMRYIGQNFELNVPVFETDAPVVEAMQDANVMREAFLTEHERIYGYRNDDAPIEIINHRLTVVGTQRQPEQTQPSARTGTDLGPVGQRQVYFDGDAPHETNVYARASLPFGHVVHGPAIIEQLDATVPVYPGDTARVGAAGTLMIEVNHD